MLRSMVAKMFVFSTKLLFYQTMLRPMTAIVSSFCQSGVVYGREFDGKSEFSMCIVRTEMTITLIDEQVLRR